MQPELNGLVWRQFIPNAKIERKKARKEKNTELEKMYSSSQIMHTLQCSWRVTQSFPQRCFYVQAIQMKHVLKFNTHNRARETQE